MLQKATSAKQANESASIEEQIKLAYIEYKTSNSLNNEYTFKQAIDNANIDYEKFEENDNEYDITVLLQNQTEKLYVISKDGNLNAYTITWKKLEDGTITDGNVILNVGDYINYESILEEVTLNNSQTMKDIYQYLGTNSNMAITQEINLKWRVLDVKYGELLLISDTPTNSKLRCYYFNGYNNMVYFLNEICNTLYSSDKGTSRNLNIEDIERTLNYNYKGYTSYNGMQYGKTKKYETDALRFPTIYRNEKGIVAIDEEKINGKLGLSEQTKEDITDISTDESVNNSYEVTQTYWNKTMNENDFKNSMYFELFINNGSNYPIYWLSSRAVNCNDNRWPYFMQRTVSNGYIGGNQVADKYGSSNDFCNALRPIVTLNSNVQIQKDEMHDGSQEKACLIK